MNTLLLKNIYIIKKKLKKWKWKSTWLLKGERKNTKVKLALGLEILYNTAT